MRIVQLLLASLFMLGIAVAVPAAGAIEGRDGWIREAPPGAPVRAGYVELHNGGDTAVTVSGARSPAFGAIEIHEMVGDGDVMRMRRMPGLELSAGEAVRLQPGGKHLMLFRPRAPLSPGEKVTVTLDLADGSSVDIELVQR